MDTAEGNIEDEACESSMVVVTNTTVHPRTMVVHLLTAPGKEREKKEREERKRKWWRRNRKGERK